jgi:hypothetical protein
VPGGACAEAATVGLVGACVGACCDLQFIQRGVAEFMVSRRADLTSRVAATFSVAAESMVRVRIRVRVRVAACAAGAFSVWMEFTVPTGKWQ